MLSTETDCPTAPSYRDLCLTLSPTTQPGKYQSLMKGPGFRSGGNFVIPEGANAATDIGAGLFDAVFTNAMAREHRLACLLGDGVRLTLVVEGEQLQSLPWEFLYDPSTKNFLVLSERSPVIRRRRASPSSKVLPEFPLQVLVLVADTTGTRDVDAELALLRTREAKGMLHLRVVKPATPTAFWAAVQNSRYDVLHFIGTGIEQDPWQALALVPEPHAAEAKAYGWVPEFLGSLVYAQPDLRLVVLNGGCTDRIATNLAMSFAAVIGLRGVVTEGAALAFSEGLYASLVAGQPLEAAVTSGRLMIRSRDPGGQEWSAPVLYLSNEDIPQPTSEPSEPTPTSTPQALGQEPEQQVLAYLISMQEANLQELQSRHAGFEDNVPEYLQPQLEKTTQTIDRLRGTLAPGVPVENLW